MPTQQQARAAKNIARQILNRPPWGRGIGLGCLNEAWVDAGGVCVPAVRLGVQRQEHVAIARRLLGESILGVPVLIDVVGDFYASDAASPPFGQPAGHVGGSYDWWWARFGRPAGMPYAP